MPERRSRFLINKPLQFRYMAYITLILFSVAGAVVGSLYFGIWGSVLDAFSNEQIRNDLLIASRLTEYETARTYSPTANSSLAFFKQAEKLSDRQKEIFKQVLDETNQKIIPKFLALLFLIAWGSIYLSHKIAGPLYRFQKTFEEVEKGNLRTRIHLRKGDEAQALGIRFNKALESLDFTFARLKNIISENETNSERMQIRLREELSKIRTSADH